MEGQFAMAVHALQLLLEWHRLLILVLGVVIGLAIGCMPGLGGVVALAVLIPFTYNLDAPTSFALLLGVALVFITLEGVSALVHAVTPGLGLSPVLLADLAIHEPEHFAALCARAADARAAV